jgi:hypothetical protein
LTGGSEMAGAVSARRPIDRALYEAVREVVLEARSRFIEYRNGGGWISTVSEVFRYDEFNSGLPHLTRDLDSEIPDYKAPFGPNPGEWNPIAYGEWPSVKALASLAAGHEGLRRTSYFASLFSGDERGELLYQYEIENIPFDVFARLMYVVGDGFGEMELCNVYCELEAGRLWRELPISMLVPIACTRIEPEDAQIAPNIRVNALSTAQQLARASDNPNPLSSVNETVAMAASHALQIENARMKNREGSTADPYMSLGFYPTAEIDRFFDALRVVTGLDTGYAQLYIAPQGWAQHFKLGLPTIMPGASARRYPPKFDYYGWLGEKESVSAPQLAEVAKLYGVLSKRDQLGLAARRLSTGMLRETSDDAILDLLIGLEAALSDEKSKTEITHKLAMRSAAVLAGSSDFVPADVFTRVKKLYEYRSAVVHGNAKGIVRLKTIEIDGARVASTDLAAYYLREVIRVLAMRDDLTNARAIDEKLILAALNSDAADAEASGNSK